MLEKAAVVISTLPDGMGTMSAAKNDTKNIAMYLYKIKYTSI